MEPRVEIRHLRAFVAVVEAGSFTAGARILNVSQPALSQNLAVLEQSLDIHLLDRGPGGISLTPAGTALLSEARSLIGRFEKALAVVASFSPEATAALQIAVPLEVTVQPLADALSKLAASPFRNTAVQISRLSCPAQLAALKKGSLDLGLVRERPVDEDLDVALMAEEPLGALVAAEQARSLNLGTVDLRLDDLASLEWLGFPRSESPAWHDHVVAVLRNHGIAITAETSLTTELPPEVKLAQLSMGGRFALAPRKCFEELPQTVLWLPLAGEPLVRRTWIVWPAWSRRKDLALLVAAMETDCSR
jgi:DNA-binding transcriptional LysR family regulator